MAHKLLESQTGTPAGVFTSGAAQNNDAQIRTIFCWGVFGEAAVAVQYGPSADGPWFSDKTGESSFTEDDMRTIQIGASLFFRATITGATAGTNVNLIIF